MFLTSMIMGVKIRTMWMTPFYLFFGVLLIYVFQSQINLNRLKNFATAFLILFVFSPFAYAYVSITETDKRTDYPGREIAKAVQEWHDKERGKKIYHIAGDEWRAGNLSYHLKDRPKWQGPLKGKLIDTGEKIFELEVVILNKEERGGIAVPRGLLKNK